MGVNQIDRQQNRENLTMTIATLKRSFCISFLALAGALSVSPLNAAPSQPHTWRNVQIVGGGFIPGVVYSRATPGLVYARTDIGGAYRLDTATGKWIPLTDALGWDDWNLTGIVSIAADPSDANRVYLAAGTYTNSWTTQNGAILRSADRGATWQRAMLPFKIGGNMPGRGAGERLAVDPNNSNVLYLGAPSGNGLWRSTDAGVTWAKVTSFTAVGSYTEGSDEYLGDMQGVYWVTFDPRTGTPGRHHSDYLRGRRRDPGTQRLSQHQWRRDLVGGSGPAHRISAAQGRARYGEQLLLHRDERQRWPVWRRVGTSLASQSHDRRVDQHQSDDPQRGVLRFQRAHHRSAESGNHHGDRL
jgi:hypothetical protein